MKFSGLNKTTLLDYPNHLACIVFVSGCNFRCPYCHNSSLVLNEVADSYSEESILHFLEKRKNVLEGICISGGEPTLYSDLKDFIVKVKMQTGLNVKLDTNGTNPQLLQELIDEQLVDYVAMDAKAGIDNYHSASGIKNECLTDNIQKSINILKHSNVDHEFRTTVVKGIHDLDDFEAIGKMLSGNSKCYVQNYLDAGDILSKRNQGTEYLSSFSEPEMYQIVDALNKYLPNTKIRNL